MRTSCRRRISCAAHSLFRRAEDRHGADALDVSQSRLLCADEVEAILLDGHFVIEHGARSRSGHFFNFNGTAGVWRRNAIDDAGGWQHDTLTEDTDLSYRAQLRGWKFLYLPDVECPSELPVEMNAFKAQQARWAKGLMQTAKEDSAARAALRCAVARKIEADLPSHGRISAIR